MERLEHRTIAKVTARLVPFLIVCFFVAYLDRVNVSFAALTMNRDLHFSPSVYGFGAGIFFLSYSIFQVPANLMLHRFGARRWIAAILVAWGAAASATWSVLYWVPPKRGSFPVSFCTSPSGFRRRGLAGRRLCSCAAMSPHS